MDFKVELINWNQLWDVAGPFLIAIIAAFAVGVVAIVILKILPSGTTIGYFKVMSIVLIIGTFFYVLITTSGIWGSK